jgi:arsenate reductase (thioredoxin)
MTKQKILFLCTGNSARSQMAEAFVRRHADDRFEAHSAGLEPKGLNPLTLRVMNEVGIDVSGQESKNLDAYRGKMPFDYLITVCDDADQNCPAVWPGVHQRMHWSFQDPTAVQGSEEKKLAAFRKARDLIEAKVKDWLREIAS